MKVTEYNVSNNKLMILSVLILYLYEQEDNKSEIIKLFILISILLDRNIREGYKTNKNFEYFLKREEKIFSRYNIYLRINQSIDIYKNKILESIFLGIQLNILCLDYNDVKKEVFVKLISSNLKKLPQTKLFLKNSIFKNINKLHSLTHNIETRDLIYLLNLEV